jgi:secondary thiamine-phosphate synthase enzyme
MLWFRRFVQLRAKSRGCHLITSELIDGWTDLRRIRMGFLNVFIQHTSASLTVNENADADVRTDLESSLNQLAPEDFPYVHTLEGPDDMPAHVKASLMGCSVTVPVGDGKLLLGTWQGIYLCEHRDRGGPRRLVLTLYGDGDSGAP